MSKPDPSSLNWSAIKLLAMDVDGILTDGSVYTFDNGLEAKRFSVLDGLGLAMTRDAGIILALISGRMSGATTERAAELKIPHVIQGRKDKITALKEIMAELDLSQEEVVYMGDDIIDAEALRHAGIGVAVPAAMPLALEAADFVTQRAGGAGAVREVCDLILQARS